MQDQGRRVKPKNETIVTETKGKYYMAASRLAIGYSTKFGIHTSILPGLKLKFSVGDFHGLDQAPNVSP